MITKEQKNYILDLLYETSIDSHSEEDINELTKQEASNLIKELIEVKEDMN